MPYLGSGVRVRPAPQFSHRDPPGWGKGPVALGVWAPHSGTSRHTGRELGDSAQPCGLSVPAPCRPGRVGTCGCSPAQIQASVWCVASPPSPAAREGTPPAPTSWDPLLVSCPASSGLLCPLFTHRPPFPGLSTQAPPRPVHPRKACPLYTPCCVCYLSSYKILGFTPLEVCPPPAEGHCPPTARVRGAGPVGCFQGPHSAARPEDHPPSPLILAGDVSSLQGEDPGHLMGRRGRCASPGAQPRAWVSPGGGKAEGAAAGTSPSGLPRGRAPSASPPCWTATQRVTYTPSSSAGLLGSLITVDLHPWPPDYCLIQQPGDIRDLASPPPP